MTHSRKTRQLAAVMFTDIVGYTALMQKDEKKASVVRAKHRAVFEEKHKIHNGKVIQYFGDGTLSTFKSVVECIECATAIQIDLNTIKPIPIRIGIHLGDIVFDGTEIYGDGVNVASRIENLSIPGAILISKKVQVELANHPSIKTMSMGEYAFKNVIDPIEVFAIDHKKVYVPNPNEIAGKLHKKEKSIAVLPLANYSSDPENEYFADGMTEEIINALTTVKNLNVTSRTSSFYFKNKNIPIKQIGAELNVATILEGSIRISKNKMRLTAQLIDVGQDFHFWSETFDRSLDDIFAVQDEISLLIADKLREHLGHLEVSEHLVEKPTVPVKIYKKYLRARYLLFKMEKSSLQLGLSILQEITTKHPNYADAQLAINLGYTLLGTIGLIPAAEAFLLGHPALEKALEIDKNKPECQLHLSWMALLQEWNLPKAYSHLNKIREVKSIIDYYQTMAATLVAENKTKAAHQYLDTAFQLDPFSHINYHLRGFTYYVEGHYKLAIENYLQALNINPHFTASILYLGQAHILLSEYKQAADLFKKVDDRKLNDILNLGGMTLINAALGEIEKVQLGIKKIETYLDTELAERAIYFLIIVHAILKNRDQTLDFLTKGIAMRLPMMIYMEVEPFLQPFKSDQKIASKLKGILIKSSPTQKPKKYQKALLTKKEIKAKKTELLVLMDSEKPFLDPDLSLRELAKKIKLPPNYLSQLLNEGIRKNFSEFINTYRVEKFKKIAVDPDFQHLSLLGLAFESGFNSKTTFNTFFKRFTGMTPKEFVNQK